MGGVEMEALRVVGVFGGESGCGCVRYVNRHRGMCGVCDSV